MNQRVSITAQSHAFVLQHLKLGDIAIDATIGNGHDTLFLCQQVGNKGLVFGFDVQKQAIESSHSKLVNGIEFVNYQLIHANHSCMDEYVATEYHGKVNVIIFNLGYLPGSNKSIITQSQSTLIALQKSIQLLDPAGIISITAYPGHPGGKIESDQVEQWCLQLNPKKYTIEHIKSLDKESAPRLFIIKSTLCA